MIHASRVAVSQAHRRAKTDRLDTELLKRGFLGWLRGERGHCSMARVPTITEEDAKRPNRERECLVKERTRLVNWIKSTLARLGIRNFKPTLRQAAERLAIMHTPEGTPVPPNALAELQRDMARLGFVVSQIWDSSTRVQSAFSARSASRPAGYHARVIVLRCQRNMAGQSAGWPAGRPYRLKVECKNLGWLTIASTKIMLPLRPIRKRLRRTDREHTSGGTILAVRR